jgi:hypothetical protein
VGTQRTRGCCPVIYVLNALLFQCRHSGRVCNELDNFGCVGADGHGACMAGDDRDVKELFDCAIDAEPFGACPFGQINDLDAAPWFAVGVFQLLIECQPFKAFVARFGQADIGKAVAGGETAGKSGAVRSAPVPHWTARWDVFGLISPRAEPQRRLRHPARNFRR